MFCRKRAFVLTGLKVSSLACKRFKCFTDQKIMQVELNFEGLEIKKWNIAADRTQRVGENNGVICLVIMLTPRVMVIKMSKRLIFCIFCWRQQNINLSLGKLFKRTGKVFQKMLRFIGFGVTVRGMSKVEIS